MSHILIGSLFIINLFFIGNFELTYDESYYWMYSKYLSLGYFDHPPMVAVFIKLGTMLFGDTEFGVRFFFNVLSALTIGLLYSLFQRKKIWIFAVLILSMPLISFSGILALPDTPLLFFATLFFWILKKYYKNDSNLNSILLAVSIAGMFYSKYHGLLIVLLTVASNLGLLKKSSFWKVVGLVVLLFLPHIYWQYLHDFVSFKFHISGRSEKHFDLKNIFNYISTQWALFGFITPIYLLWITKGGKNLTHFEKAIKYNSIGFFLFILLLSLRNSIEANWTVTACAAFMIYIGSRVEEKHTKPIMILSIFPIVLMLGLRFIILTPKTVINYLGRYKESRLNEIAYWTDERVPAILRVCGKNKIISDTYQVGAKLSFYTNKMIPVTHIRGRSSHYSLLKLQNKIGANERICFLSTQKSNDALVIDTNYHQPIYILKDTTLNKLATRYGTTYEKIIGNQ